MPSLSSADFFQKTTISNQSIKRFGYNSENSINSLKLENYSFLLSSADLFLIFFSKKYFRKTIRVSNDLDPDQVGPDLGPN